MKNHFLGLFERETAVYRFKGLFRDENGIAYRRVEYLFSTDLSSFSQGFMWKIEQNRNLLRRDNKLYTATFVDNESMGYII